MDSTQDEERIVANEEVSTNVDQRNSFDDGKLEEIVRRIVKEENADPRNEQSRNDKLLAAFKKNKGFKDYFREIQSMRDSGMSDKEIERVAGITDREEEIDARLRQLEESRTAQNSVGNTVKQPDNNAIKVLAQALKLDLNNPDVVRELMKDKQEDQIIGLTKIAERQNAEPNPALVGTSTGSSKEPDLLEEYQAKAARLRGDALIDLKLEYSKKGLRIS